MDSAEILEWFFETIDKRLGQGIPLEELFACIPYQDEAEFEYELLHVFKYAEKRGILSQGNNLERDYPNIFKLAKSSNKVLKIRIFFVKPNRLHANLILWKRKYNYPKINLGRRGEAFELDNTDILKAYREHVAKEKALGLTS